MFSFSGMPILYVTFEWAVGFESSVGCLFSTSRINGLWALNHLLAAYLLWDSSELLDVCLDWAVGFLKFRGP